ncbi:hypothetical protein NDU88_003115 [Pleurodeles waltl]|uniref:Uncharacterized protein n=1 Tax=Pleurodeles waltl TaxID=8319 RepID=A0AAV7KY11_PLEWA|nr:hypothetical protein NDU88_003115 [Pleurodeles waltl]
MTPDSGVCSTAPNGSGPRTAEGGGLRGRREQRGPHWWSALLPHLARQGTDACGVAGAGRTPTSGELRWRPVHPGARQSRGPGSLAQCCWCCWGDVGLLLRSLGETQLWVCPAVGWTGRPRGQYTYWIKKTLSAGLLMLLRSAFPGAHASGPSPN